jgi:hypothetical protein
MEHFIDFYRHVIYNDESCTNFLKQRGVLPTAKVCQKVNSNNEVCGGALKEYMKNTRKRDGEGKVIKEKFLRCRKKGCQTFQSIRKQNKFFTYVDVNGKNNSGLSLCHIVELVWYWCNEVNVTNTAKWTGRARHTVTDWFNLCRDVCVDQFELRSKMGGTGVIVQIDESLFQGKRKYHRGRLCVGDRTPATAITRTSPVSSDVESDSSDDSEPVYKNYGSRVQGPWVFGLYCKRDDGVTDRRFFIVEKRDRATLLPIIQREVEVGSTIHSDEWRAYSNLSDHGYVHKTVNHQLHFIDPETGANTQSIESTWRRVKVKYGIKTRGATNLLERQLMEEWWRSLNASKNLFDRFFEDMKKSSLM